MPEKTWCPQDQFGTACGPVCGKFVESRGKCAEVVLAEALVGIRAALEALEEKADRLLAGADVRVRVTGVNGVVKTALWTFRRK